MGRCLRKFRNSIPILRRKANFNRFRVLASLLHRHRSTEVNQTLQDVWPSPGLVHYLYIFGVSCPATEFYQVQNSLCFEILRSFIFAVLLHGTRVVGVSQTLRRSPEAPPIFSRTAITLSIGPHSNSDLICSGRPLFALSCRSFRRVLHFEKLQLIVMSKS